MKSLTLLISFICCILNAAFSQNPLVKQWDKRFGGTLMEWLYDFHQTSDGGYILGGISRSGINGDKTQPLWGGYWEDYWIVKTDSIGNKQWDKDFGGTDREYFTFLYQTADGGYILGGYSQSDSSGDKTQPMIDPCNTCPDRTDFWIVKTDSSGNKQWDKVLGGTNSDRLYSLQQTFDGGYILGGSSHSDSSGNKSQNTWQHSFDYWIVKTDSLGNKQWDKDFGGKDNDILRCVRQTADGGYILGGISLSNIGGDKTEPNRDSCTCCLGRGDYWIVKTDSLGNKQWDKDFGGDDQDDLYSLQQTADGGFILAGLTSSDSSWDKTQNCVFDSIFLANTLDYWIIKTDSLGNKQWDKDYGGTYVETYFGNISLTADGGFLIAGCSASDAGGNKTEDNMGVQQTWIIKTDSSGTIQWDKTVLSNGYDGVGYAIQTKDGCYATTNSGNGAVGGYKSQDPWGGQYDLDYWIVKFCDSTASTSITQLMQTQLPFTIYPNPLNDYIVLNSNLKTGDEIRLSDTLGKPLFKTKIKTPTSNFKLQTYRQIYILSKQEMK